MMKKQNFLLKALKNDVIHLGKLEANQVQDVISLNDCYILLLIDSQL